MSGKLAISVRAIEFLIYTILYKMQIKQKPESAIVYGHILYNFSSVFLYDGQGPDMRAIQSVDRSCVQLMFFDGQV